MPINWNNENSLKLLIAIVQQVRANSIKLDYNQLATRMGPGIKIDVIINGFALADLHTQVAQ
ncbi:uncharacterized protein N7469_006201 [Penicillium citrinum]|uniref:Uncharacterized protein n=1 Tax=Penicillium citrinum TaxID=5077 RepID=A0A9W9P092_PENCI|nr:uncharacterized protein N7469_006201 [Penicillium citrinum]KAJ5231613.1 hypothetical protein N7469_006201 [Penicillium citrinum]